MPDPQPELRAVFCEALERKGPRERADYLDRACQGKPELRARVEALLRANDEASSFLKEPSETPLDTVDEPAGVPVAAPLGEGPDTRIGPYRLVQPIGEGGMGAVFLAEQTEPVRRRVALKIIKAGMDSGQVLARFEAERQALALMDHPNIARVLDAGTTAGEPGGVSPGRPYFVMELVQGVPITRYCDGRRLPPRQRLELFIPVCQAVQHAHQKGVIHRDLKPSNVLVTLYDGRPVPKVIDFGIAKATAPELADRAGFTEVGQVVGTLEYMSPEQAGLNPHDIDTRSDVYSLGVMLYELLTGTTPLERRRLKEESLLEALRQIREEEWPRPSARLSAVADLSAVAAARGLEPKKLAGQVQGEPDWIVMKCLEKDRNRRYETANGLARDIERYLQNEPVQAGPPSALYRLRKFARRNKVGLTAAGLVLLTLVLGVVVSTSQMFRAMDAEGDARNKAEDLRRKERQTTIDLSTFLMDKGLDLCAQGDVGLGMLWLARALETAPEDAADLQRVIRVNLASWHHQSLQLKAILAHTGTVEDVVVSPDGKTVTTLERDHDTRGGVVRRWEAASGKQIGSPLCFQQEVWPGRSSEFREKWVLAHNGKALVTVPDGRTAQLWDLTTGRRIGPPLPIGPFTEVIRAGVGFTPSTEVFPKFKFTPDSRMLLTNNGRTVQLWEAASGKPIGRPIEPPVGCRSAALIAGGRTVVTSSILPSGTTPDGRPVLTTAGKLVQFWEAASGKPLGQPIEAVMGLAAISPDGEVVLTAGAKDKQARLWRAATGEEMKLPLPHEQGISGAVFSPDGRLVLTEWSVNTILPEIDRFAQLWDVASGQKVGPVLMYGFSGVGTPVFSPSGSRVVTYGPKEARVWKGPSMNIFDARPLAQPAGVGKVVFSPDGRTLLTQGLWDTTVRLWDAATGKLVGSPLAQPERAVAFTFGPDGRTVLTQQYPAPGWQDCSILLWEAASGKPLPLWSQENTRLRLPMTWEAIPGKVFGDKPSLRFSFVAFSPDGKRLLKVFQTVSDQPAGTHKECTVGRLTEAATGKPTGSLLVVEDGLDIVISPDWKSVSTTVARWHLEKAGTGGRSVDTWTPDKDKTVRRWELGTWKSLGPPSKYEGSGFIQGSDSIEIIYGLGTLPAPRLLRRPEQLGWAALFPAPGPGFTNYKPPDVVVDTWQPAGPPPPLKDGARVIAFSPDRTLVLAAVGHDARLVEATTGKLVGSLLAHQDAVTAGAFSPDSRIVATGSKDKTARLWDVATGQTIGQPVSHQDDVRAVAFSPDGRTLLTAGKDHIARFWDTALTRPLGPPLHLPQSEWPQQVAFNPDGRTVVVATGKGDLSCWEAPPAPLNDPVQKLVLWVQTITDRQLDSDGVIGWQTGQAWKERRRLLEELGGPPVPPPPNLGSWHRDLIRVCAKQEDWFAALWHLDRWVEAEPPQWQLHFERGKVRAKLGQKDSAAADFARVNELGAGIHVLDPNVSVAVFSPDSPRGPFGRSAWVAQVADVQNWKDLRRPVGHTGLDTAVSVAVFSPDGRRTLLGLADGTVRVWDTAGGKELRCLEGHSGVIAGAALSGDGSRALTSSIDNARMLVRLWDLENGRGLNGLECPRATRVSLSPDGRRFLLYGEPGGGVRVWDAEKWQEARRFDPGSALDSLVYLPNGRQALSREGNHRRLWDVEQGKEVTRFEGLNDLLTSEAFSPNSRYGLSGSKDGETLCLWEVETGKEVRRFRRADGQPLDGDLVFVQAFSHDGRLALSADGGNRLGGSDNRSVRLWDVRTGKELGFFGGELPRIIQLAFSADDRQAIAVCDDGTIRTWRSTPTEGRERDRGQ